MVFLQGRHQVSFLLQFRIMWSWSWSLFLVSGFQSCPVWYHSSALFLELDGSVGIIMGEGLVLGSCFFVSNVLVSVVSVVVSVADEMDHLGRFNIPWSGPFIGVVVFDSSGIFF
jgi:hypothetical protein